MKLNVMLLSNVFNMIGEDYSSNNFCELQYCHIVETTCSLLLFVLVTSQFLDKVAFPIVHAIN